MSHADLIKRLQDANLHTDNMLRHEAADALAAQDAQLNAAREFVLRHPMLGDADLAEFEAFLKVPAALAKTEENP